MPLLRTSSSYICILSTPASLMTAILITPPELPSRDTASARAGEKRENKGGWGERKRDKGRGGGGVGEDEQGVWEDEQWVGEV